MGKHRAVEAPQVDDAPRVDRVGALVRAGLGVRGVWALRVLRFFGTRRWFRGDWWWLAGFCLGLCTGTLGAFSAFLWWLTGDMGRFIDSVMEKLF